MCAIEIGCCGSLNQAELFKKCGFQYLESNISQIVSMEEKEFQEALSQIRELHFPVKAANCFLPGDWPVAHGERDLEKDQAYLEKAAKRLSALGCGVAVLGSGGARGLSAEYGLEKGKEQFLSFYRLALEVFAPYNLFIAIEPLRKTECNWLNTIGETLSYIEGMPQKNRGVICDFYHLAQENEPLSILKTASPLLRHCHIAHPVSRLAPLPQDGGDYEEDFRFLLSISYTGCVSLEANWQNSETILKESAAYLQECLQRAAL